MITPGRLLAVTALALLLAACAVTPGNPVPQADQEAVRQLVLDAVDRAFAASALDDEVQLGAGPTERVAGSVEPFIVLRRTRMERSRDLIEITIDPDAQPPTATVEVDIRIGGVAELWQVHPDLSAPPEPVGRKRILLTGSNVFTLEKPGDEWQLVAVDLGAKKQGEGAAEVVSWSPTSFTAGSRDTVLEVVLAEPDTSDQFLVLVRGGHLRPRSLLNDNGTGVDDTADDDVYHGTVDVGPGADPGRHLAFVHATNFTRTTDLTTDDEGDFVHPYTDTLQPVIVVVEVAE